MLNTLLPSLKVGNHRLTKHLEGKLPEGTVISLAQPGCLKQGSNRINDY